MKTKIDTSEILTFVSTVSREMMEESNSYSEIFERNLNNYNNAQQNLQSVSINLDNLKIFDNEETEAKMSEISHKNSIFLNKLEKEKDEFQKNLEELEKKNMEAEKTVKTLEQELASLNAKQLKIDKKRAKILVYKILTNTTFCYESSSVKGYVIGESPENVKCFDLNPKKLSRKEITDALYETLKKVYNDPADETTNALCETLKEVFNDPVKEMKQG